MKMNYGYSKILNEYIQSISSVGLHIVNIHETCVTKYYFVTITPREMCVTVFFRT